MLEAGATRSLWPAADLGGWRCCHEWAFGKPGILEGKRIGRLAGILRNAAKENLRQTPSGFAGQGSLWPAEKPGGRLLEAEDLGSQSFSGTGWKLALSSPAKGSWRLALNIACWPKVVSSALQIVGWGCIWLAGAD